MSHTRSAMQGELLEVLVRKDLFVTKVKILVSA